MIRINLAGPRLRRLLWRRIARINPRGSLEVTLMREPIVRSEASACPSPVVHVEDQFDYSSRWRSR